MPCPCGSLRDHDLCCGPFLRGEARAPTAEALMRSRYCAYVQGNIDYIERTLAPEKRVGFDRAAAKAWSDAANWLGLKILATEKGLAGDREGFVEFVATYRQKGETISHHERSRFRRTESGEWVFVDGDTAIAPAAKAGRNDPCPCGSGKKFKKCCGA